MLGSFQPIYSQPVTVKVIPVCAQMLTINLYRYQAKMAAIQQQFIRWFGY
jgi:hypothetical protein